MVEKTLQKYIDVLEKIGVLEEIGLTQEERELSIGHISYNSLDVRPRTLFICKGQNFKEEYLRDAVEKGAICYLAEKKLNADLPFILVSDMRTAMSQLGKEFYDQIWNDKLHMIGITGTKGKSTTATFVKAILDDYCQSQGFNDAGLISGIYNFDGVHKVKAKKITTPETLDLHRLLASCAENGCKYLVMETSSQALKYHRTDALNYEVGGFLNISEDHISGREHENMEDYFSSKLKLFGQCRTSCINLEIEKEYLDRAFEAAKANKNKIVTFGRVKDADYFGYEVASTPQSLMFKVDCEGRTEEIEVSIGGFYNTANALAAIAMTRALDIPFENIKRGLAHVKVAGRMEVYRLENKHVDVIVDYAHNKLSYETLFENIKRLYPYRKVLLICGCVGNKAYNRRKELGEIANRYADRIILTEQDAGTEPVQKISDEIKKHIESKKTVEIIEDRGEAIKVACETIDDDWVMVVTGNGADSYQKRGLVYVEIPTDGERVQEYIDNHRV